MRQYVDQSANRGVFLPEEGLGYQPEEDWTATQDLLTKYFGLTEERPVSEYYTNEFLPEEDFLG